MSIFNFLHTFQPQAILLNLGLIKIHWYGLIMVLAIIFGYLTVKKINKYYKLITNNQLLDLCFYLVIFCILGARLYDVLLELPHYLQSPLDIFKIWQGGLAIHGSIIVGILTVLYFAKKYKTNFWQLGSILVPGLVIGQAIGRWGNYFNQELFGRPTNLAWGIPIELAKRPLDYLEFTYFQPTFLYESLGCLIIFCFLILFHYLNLKKITLAESRVADSAGKSILIFYLIAYSILRFSLEFIKIDQTPTYFGLRWPQIMSLIIIISCLTYFIISLLKRRKEV